MGTKINTKQAAEICGVAASSLEAWRCRGAEFQPPYYQVGKRIIYDQAEVERWMQSCRVTRRGGV